MQSNEFAFPFDAEEIDGGYDRTYVADDFARYFRAYITSGVFMSVTTSLQTLADSAMNVTLAAGSAIIEGYRYELESDMSFTIEPADGTLNRIDRMCIVWDQASRDIHAEVVKGTASYDPIAPTRRWGEEYKELVSADIYVGAGVTSIQQKDITDRRIDSTLCGLATPWEKVDTESLYDQIQNDLAVFKAEYEASMTTWGEAERAEFDTWFATIQGILGKDEAGKLLNLINENTERDFKRFYGVANAESGIARSDDGSIASITTTNADESVEAIATFNRNTDGSIASIVTLVTPDEGSYTYTQTVTFSRNTDGSIAGVSESYEQNTK